MNFFCLVIYCQSENVWYNIVFLGNVWYKIAVLSFET